MESDLLNNFAKIAPHLANPFVLIGFVLFLVFSAHRTLIKSKVLQPVERKTSGIIVLAVLRYGFWIGVLLIVFGVGYAAWKTYFVSHFMILAPAQYLVVHAPDILEPPIVIDRTNNTLLWRPVFKFANASNAVLAIDEIRALPTGSAIEGGKPLSFGLADSSNYYINVFDSEAALQATNPDEYEALDSTTSATLPLVLKAGEAKVVMLHEELTIIWGNSQPSSLPSAFRDQQKLLHRIVSADNLNGNANFDKNGNFRCGLAHVVLEVDFVDNKHFEGTSIMAVPSDGCYYFMDCPYSDLATILKNWRSNSRAAANEISPLAIYKGRTTPFRSQEILEMRRRLAHENLPQYYTVFPEDLAYFSGGLIFKCVGELPEPSTRVQENSPFIIEFKERK